MASLAEEIEGSSAVEGWDIEMSQGREDRRESFVQYAGDVWRDEGRLQLLFCCSSRFESRGTERKEVSSSLPGFLVGVSCVFSYFMLLI